MNLSVRVQYSTRRTDHDLHHLDPIAAPMRKRSEDLDPLQITPGKDV